MKNVLITGGCGYIGSMLATELVRQGFNVTVLDNLMYKKNTLAHLSYFDNFKFVKGDVCDRALMAKLLKSNHIIFPLAAIVGAPICDEYPGLAEEVNLNSINFLAESINKNHLIIYPTTNSGYGTKSGDKYCDENTPLEPISLYGRTKCQAELLLLKTGRAITFRLATVFGGSYRTRYDLLFNNFVMKAVLDGKIDLYEEDFKRNFIHIRDVVDCFSFAIENHEKMIGEIFNAGNDEANISKKELCLKIKEIIPSLEILKNSSMNDPDKRNYIVSNQKLRKIGFEAKLSVDGGILEMIKIVEMENEFKSNYRL